GRHRGRTHHVRPQLDRRARQVVKHCSTEALKHCEDPMRRRDFLSGLALAPGLAAVRLPQTTAAPPAPHGLKLGIVTYNIAKDWDIPTIIANLTEAGFDAVELR